MQVIHDWAFTHDSPMMSDSEQLRLSEGEEEDAWLVSVCFFSSIKLITASTEEWLASYTSRQHLRLVYGLTEECEGLFVNGGSFVEGFSNQAIESNMRGAGVEEFTWTEEDIDESNINQTMISVMNRIRQVYGQTEQCEELLARIKNNEQQEDFKMKVNEGEEESNMRGAVVRDQATVESNVLFQDGDEEFTWTEGNSIKNIVMKQDMEEYRLIEFKLHLAREHPAFRTALELIQEVNMVENGVKAFYQTNVYKNFIF